MALQDSVPGPGAALTDGENRARSNTCFLMRAWACLAGGGLNYRSS